MKILKYLGLTVAVLGAVIALAVGYLSFIKQPASRPPSDEKVELIDSRIEHGRYLYEHVAACSSCHGERDFAVLGAPVKDGASAAGSCFPEGFDVPGKVCPPNLTPHQTAGLGAWSDGELMRAIREGVDRNGEALFMMNNYKLSDEDTRAIVAYLRSRPPSDKVRTSEIAFPVKLISKFFPEPLEGPIPHPKEGDVVGYGKYLAGMAGCEGCHSGAAGLFAGGEQAQMPYGTEVVRNITPDPVAGIGQMTKEQFIQLFRGWASAPTAPPAGKAFMPWRAFAGMNEQDLGAIYEYLRTVPPVGATTET
ncbi:MAG: cytochrome c [Myxococcota bacterium]|nr:cytochrome c [Myxococcota bacterium]